MNHHEEWEQTTGFGPRILHSVETSPTVFARTAFSSSKTSWFLLYLAASYYSITFLASSSPFSLKPPLKPPLNSYSPVMASYQVVSSSRQTRQVEKLGGASTQKYEEEEDSNTTFDESDELENNPTSEPNRQAVRRALMASDRSTRSGEDSSQQVGFSIQEVKQIVLQSIPEKVKSKVSPETLHEIFNESAETVLAESIDQIGQVVTPEDVKDIITFVSIFIQRESREQPRAQRSFTERRPPQPSKSNGSLDAVTLAINSSDEKDDDDDSYDALVNGTDRTAGKDHSSELPSKPIPQAVVQQMPSEENRGISFSAIEVRYYEQILADNPAVSSGPPLGIGWQYRKMNKQMSVDAWEERRQDNRRYLTDLMTSRHDRTRLLQDLGYSSSDLAVSIREVMRVKNSRKKTFHNLQFEKLEELIEKISKSFLSIATLGLAKRKERQLLKPFADLKERKKLPPRSFDYSTYY